MRRAVLIAAASTLALASAVPSFAQDRGQERARVDVAAQASERPARAIRFAAQPETTGTLVIVAGSEADLTTRGAALDEASRALALRALANAEFGYGLRDSLSLRGLGEWSEVLILGLPADASLLDHHTVGQRLGRTTQGGAGAVSIMAQGLGAEAASEIATGVGIGGYGFERYRSRDTAWGLTGDVVMVGAEGSVFAARGQALVDAMTLARDLSNEPANVIYPETFVARTRDAFAGLRGVEITVLDEPQMARLGMGALLSVGQGSARPSRMMVVRYRGAGAPEQPTVLAGKGITFDTGGISIKPNAGMGNMKMDMSGAANVMGATLALARQGAPVHVVAIAALAENMPSGTATRPGDIVRAMNGLTIEINSADAEGRMVLADAVAWADATLNPAVIVDIATLTGSVSGALGGEYAGLFSRHDTIAQQLQVASAATGEGLWRLPLHTSYAEDLRSPVADLRNGGGSGAGAGVGAHFIGAFVSEGRPWAHLDIANMAYTNSPTATGPEGSQGFGVRLLEQFARNFTPSE
jgi:leucyl aminopeptidase